MNIKILWNGDLELVSMIANGLQSKYKMYFYGIQITKDFAIGFIIRRKR